jgi:hypothetical protein
MISAGQIVVAAGADVHQTVENIVSQHANGSFFDLITASLAEGCETSPCQKMKPGLQGTGSHNDQKTQENEAKEAQMFAPSVFPGPFPVRPSELITASALRNYEKRPPSIPTRTYQGVLNEKGTNRELPANQATSGALAGLKSSGDMNGSLRDMKTEATKDLRVAQGLPEFRNEDPSQDDRTLGNTSHDFGSTALNEGPNATAKDMDGDQDNVTGVEGSSPITAVQANTHPIAIAESALLRGNNTVVAGAQVTSTNGNTPTTEGVKSFYEDTRPSIDISTQQMSQDSSPGDSRLESFSRRSITEPKTNARLSATDLRTNVRTTNKTLGNADGRAISSKKNASPADARDDGPVRSLSCDKVSSVEGQTVSSRPTDTLPREMQQSLDVHLARPPLVHSSTDSCSTVQHSEISDGSPFSGKEEPRFSKPPLSAESPKVDHAGSVHVARILKQVERAEMHVGLRTAEFGSVEVHTVVHENKVGLSVGSERGNLPGLLASDSSALNNALQRNHLQLENLKFFEMHSGTPNGGSGGHQSNSQKFLNLAGSEGLEPTFRPREVTKDEVIPPGVRISVRV